MNRRMVYEDCINFIENNLHIKLFDYQKEIIKCFCEGKEVRVSRAIGRSTCADAFGKYIAHLYDRNDYSVDPDVLISYRAALKDGVIDERIIQRTREYLSEEAFKREFCDD